MILSLQSLSKTALSRPAGYLDDVLSHAQVDGDKVTLSQESYSLLVKKYRGPQPKAVVRRKPDETPSPCHGPGTELKSLLKTIGIVAKPNCSCNKRAQVMDQKGCDWCEEHIEEIDGWLAEEAKKRKLPYLSLAGKTLIRLAIRRARKKGNG
jgi:hypothetical protein